jgi:hypothetical protein
VLYLFLLAREAARCAGSVATRPIHDQTTRISLVSPGKATHTLDALEVAQARPNYEKKRLASGLARVRARARGFC